MNILYHLTSPLPAIPGTDAIFQEVEALQARYGGDRTNLYPLRQPSSIFPRFLYGLHMLSKLKKMDDHFDIHHVYHADLYPFPVLKHLNKPLIYSVSARIKPRKKSVLQNFAKSIHTIVINNERDQSILNQLGITNFRLIPPGIDLSKFSYFPTSHEKDFVLLVGSAPWTKKQFRQKGIDLLLGVALKMPNLRLIFLWRGLLFEELKYRIESRSLSHRILIINEKANINQILGQVHAAIVLSEKPEVVKAYPHSLLESLAAGKPVLFSHTIPMADYVSRTKCGEVVKSLNLIDLQKSISQLIHNYGEYQKNALYKSRNDFSLERMLDAYKTLYDDIMKSYGLNVSD